MRISWLLLTLNRKDTTIKAFEHNWVNAKKNLHPDHEIELLVCDNGSIDRELVEYFAPIAKYHRVNSTNEGCAKSYNQLYLRSTGDIVTFSGSDNFQPEGWLQAAIDTLTSMKKPGIAGISDGAPENRGPGWITGAYVIAKSCIKECGFFHDDFDVYGCEDLDFNERVLHMGFECQMVPGLTGSHSAHLPEDNDEYKKMKYKSFIYNSAKLHKRQAFMRQHGARTELLPEMRAPL